MEGQVQHLVVLDGRTLCLSLARYGTAGELKRVLLSALCAPATVRDPGRLLVLLADGRPLADGQPLGAAGRLLRAAVAGALCGGKGGFGANLRASGKAGGASKPQDFGACRDLQGRRLRDVNNELRLRKWLSATEAEKRRRLDSDYSEARGDSGLQAWFLGVPSWAEGIKKGGLGSAQAEDGRAARRKTVLCTDWTYARAQRQPPPDAPRWWGCPRGRACEFAHGEEDLRAGARAEAAQQAKTRALAEAATRLERYTHCLYVYSGADGEGSSGGGIGGQPASFLLSTAAATGSRSMHDSVMQGLRAEGAIGTDTSAQARAGAKRPRAGVRSDVVAATAGPLLPLALADDDGPSPFQGHGASRWSHFTSSSSSSSSISHLRAHEEAAVLPPAPLHIPSDWSPSHWVVVAGSSASAEPAAAVEFLSLGTHMHGSSSSGGGGGNDAVAEVTGLADFATVAVAGCALGVATKAGAATAGRSRWLWEVELVTSSGVAQIGWALTAAAELPTPASVLAFAPEVADGDGVGDCAASWAFDGARGLKWHGGGGDRGEDDAGSVPYGRLWAAGDFVGCWAELDAEGASAAAGAKAGRGVSLGYCLNGEDLGEAFRLWLPPGALLVPALSLDAGEVVRVNVGQAGLSFAGPAGTQPLFNARRESPLSPLPASLSAPAPALATASMPTQLEPALAAAFDLEAALAMQPHKLSGGLAVAATLTPRALLAQGATPALLRAALALRGLKAGGTGEEMAERLLAVAGVPRHDEVPRHLRGAGFPTPFWAAKPA